MLLAFGIICTVCVLLVVACFWLIDEQGATIKDLREANKRLYADNQRLTESLVRKAGEYLALTPETPEEKRIVKHAAPYWQSKQPITVNVAGKTVEVG